MKNGMKNMDFMNVNATSLAAVHTHTHTVNFKGKEKELLKNGRGAEIFSGSNFGAQKPQNCGQGTNMSCGQNVQNEGAQNVNSNTYHSHLTAHHSGITLIALIITIVIMLILAGITINLTLGENGIFLRAKQAKEQYEAASVQEKLELELTAMEVERNNGEDLTVNDYINKLKNIGYINDDNIRIRSIGAVNNGIIDEAALIIGENVYSVYKWLDKVKIEYEQNSNILLTDRAGRVDDDWLDTGVYRNEIESVNFVSTNEVPNEVLGSKDVSALGYSGTVMSWWKDTDEDGLKEFYIGAEGGVIAPKICAYLFGRMSNLENISFIERKNENEISNFDTKNVINMAGMFQDDAKLIQLELGKKFNTCNVTNMVSMFNNIKVGTLNLEDKFYTTNVTTIVAMFANMPELTTLNLGDNFDTSNVTQMNSAFYNIPKLTTLNLGTKFNTSKVIDMAYLFANLFKLTSLDLGDKFDTSNVNNMNQTFANLFALTSLDLKDKFDTSNVNNMGYMFYNTYVRELNLGNKFSTKNVTNMNYMFSTMSYLNTLNLGTLGVENVENGSLPTTLNMFYRVKSGCVITTYNSGVKAWIENVVSEIDPQPSVTIY
ncbi:MAG: BspA family leucine-rich repeat surface protein [Clostridia bacterium]|nr:BspA family leucine-rich repeat surface protein [Clostridia bacterium]